ncbi:Rrf2 family transcriptional regulator [Carnobacteriaceae bacterium zg-C25]|nr:Rrf2 family transcriptional regulator [Carnobacteriaceae bacterium zg-C25]
MQISNRFSIAIHVCVFIGLHQQKQKVTSAILAETVNVNPVVIRRILQQLKSADIIHVSRGVGGAQLAKEPECITLKDIYYAVESNGKSGQLFSIHSQNNKDCPFGQSIEHKLVDTFDDIQQTLDAKLETMTLALFSQEMQCPDTK